MLYTAEPPGRCPIDSAPVFFCGVKAARGRMISAPTARHQNVPFPVNVPLIRLVCGQTPSPRGRLGRAATGRPCGSPFFSLVGADIIRPGTHLKPSVSGSKWERPIPPIRGKCPAGTKGVGTSKGAGAVFAVPAETELGGLCEDEVGRHSKFTPARTSPPRAECRPRTWDRRQTAR